MFVFRSLRMLPLFLLFAAAPSLSAGDPLAPEFKKLANGHVADIKGAAKATVKALKSELSDSSKSFGSGFISVDEALSASVQAVTQRRDELEDIVFSHLTTLAAEGHQILVTGGSPTPGRDFQAGSGGAWDQALADAQDALDGADDDVRAAYASFLKTLAKLAKKQKLNLDVRAQIPPHDEAFWTIVPPGAQADVLADGTDDDPLRLPQILIAVRGVALGAADGLRIGVRASAASVDVLASSAGGEELSLGIVVLGASGATSTSLSIDGLAHPQGFVVAHLSDGTHESARAAVSAPSLLDPDPNADAPLVAFKKGLKESKKALSKATSEALEDFKNGLTQSTNMMQAGAADPDAAVKQGFSDLRAAREAMSLAWQDFVATTAEAASLALAGAGVADDALPPEFQPDVAGLAATNYKTALKQLDSRQLQLSKAYDSFVDKTVKAAAKLDFPFDANRVLGRLVSFAAPMVSGAATPPLLPATPPRLPDGLLLALPVFVTDLDGPLDLTLLFDFQADLSQFNALSASMLALPGGPVTDFGSQALGPGGTQMKQTPLGQDDSPGWILRTGATLSEPAAETVLTPPKLSDD